MLPKTNIFGWRGKEPDDERDYPFALLRAVQPPPRLLPPKVDLRAKMTPVEDQGELGSCVANAAVGAAEFLQHRAQARWTDLSRLFVYYKTRELEGTVDEDAGSYIRNAVKALAKSGVCPEEQWPYDVARFRDPPPRKASREALKRQARSYFRCDTIGDIKASLAEGFPVLFGFRVYRSQLGSTVNDGRGTTAGDLGLPKKGERPIGGHAVLAVGYDDKRQRILFRNSWGPSWGRKGYGTIPYAFVADPRECDDFWTVRDIEMPKEASKMALAVNRERKKRGARRPAAGRRD